MADTPTPRQPRLESLDGIRPRTASGRLPDHDDGEIGIGLEPLVPGLEPVDLVFVLSGFVIAETSHDRIGSWRDYGHCPARRGGRTHPLHIPVSILAPGLGRPWLGASLGASMAPCLLSVAGVLWLSPPSFRPVERPAQAWSARLEPCPIALQSCAALSFRCDALFRAEPVSTSAESALSRFALARQRFTRSGPCRGAGFRRRTGDHFDETCLGGRVRTPREPGIAA